MADVKVIGQMDNTIDNTFESANRVYDVEGVAPTMNTCGGGGLQPKILENKIVAMRGRNPDNPSDRTAGSPTEQRLEVNMQGTSNCLTSVQKDNFVLENVYDFYNDKMKQDCVCGTLTTGTAHNGSGTFGVVEGITTKGKHIDVASTILSGYERTNMTGFNADNGVVETINKVGQISNDGSQYGTVIADNGLSPNLVAGTHGYANSCIATQYRIRKLTPRECGRLMGVSYEDIDKMAAVNSNTQLYKQFGNSIVVDVMCAMFKNLNINQ